MQPPNTPNNDDFPSYNDPLPPSSPFNPPSPPAGGTPIASPTDYSPVPPPYYGAPPGGNDSGQGTNSRLPAELQGVNWGAFLMNWIWAIAHNSWIGLLALVPYVGIIMVFVLLFKGNEWAWQNRRWESIEQFRAVQRIWTMWGVGLMIVGCLCYVGAMALLGPAMRQQMIQSQTAPASIPQR